MEFNHVSVMLNECIEQLNIIKDGIYVDGTLGGGGHSGEICKKLAGGRLIGFDQDSDAINAASRHLADFESKTTFVHDNFCNIKSQLQQLNVEAVNGVLLDLGVSSFQLDEPSRGFSYMHDSKLDMRMDVRKSKSAYSIVNTYDEKTLTTLIQDFGEERWAKRIAQFIVAERKEKPIETTFELVSVIKKAIPKEVRKDGAHPAKRTFQAIRIEVNEELNILKQAIFDICDMLETNGRIAIITFHSLEDRIVKNAFRELEDPCACPREFPMCMCGKKSKGKVITRKPILPSENEVELNHRSRSAKLRVFEKR